MSLTFISRGSPGTFTQLERMGRSGDVSVSLIVMEALRRYFLNVAGSSSISSSMFFSWIAAQVLAEPTEDQPAAIDI